MKKLITLLLVLTGCVGTMSATSYTVYFKPSSNWIKENAKFALYMWNDDNSTHKTVDFAAHASITGVYTATYEDTYSTGCLILRVNPNASGSAGTGDGYGWSGGSLGWWAQTADLPIPYHDIFFDMSAASDWDTTIRYYVVAANSTDIIDGSSTWNGALTANAMIPASDYATSNLVKISYTSKLLTAGKTYAFKISAVNDDWHPSSNVEFTPTKNGYYTIEYTYNTDNNSVDKTVTLTQEVTYKYGVQRGVKNGNEYNYTDLGYMTNVDGTPTLTVSPLDLTASTKLLYKIKRDVFVGDVDQNASTWSWNSADGNVDGHYDYNPTLSGNHTVSFYYYPTSETTWTIGHKMDTEYYLVIQGTVNKNIPLSDTDDDGTYSATFDNQPDKWMVLFPGYAYSNETTVNWDYSIRPHGESNTTINFANNSGLIQVGGSVNWVVADTYSDYVTISFTPSTNAWSVAPYITGSISTAGYATYSHGSAYKITGEGVGVYTITATADGEATMSSNWNDAALPAGTGVVLTGSTSSATAYTVTPSDGTASIGTNLLEGSGDSEATITAEDGYDKYILANKENSVKFYKWDGSDQNDHNKLGAHKAYLRVPTGLTPAPEFFNFNFDFGGETTDLSEKVIVKSEKFATAPVYNLNGQRVANPTKGLYIVNGRKVVIK